MGAVPRLENEWAVVTDAEGGFDSVTSHSVV
jgi:hypothetical protein